MSERGGEAMFVCYTLAPRFRGVGIDDCGVSGKTPQRSEPYFTPITAPSAREGGTEEAVSYGRHSRHGRRPVLLLKRRIYVAATVKKSRFTPPANLWPEKHARSSQVWLIYIYCKLSPL